MPFRLDRNAGTTSAGVVLVWLAPTSAARWAAVVYSLRRIDHSNIYVIIAGSHTPIAVLALDGWRQQYVAISVLTYQA